MQAHQKEHTIARMAKVLRVSESGYYKWGARMHAPITKKEAEYLALTEEIRNIYYASKKISGARKITAELRKRTNRAINHKRVERLMQANCFYSKSSKKYIVTTDSNHEQAVAENLLNRDFAVDRPNEKNG